VPRRLPIPHLHRRRASDQNYFADPCLGHYDVPSSDVEEVALSSLAPASGRVGTKVIVHGSGFAKKGNDVLFADSLIRGVRSRDGKMLAFRVPSRSTHPCFTAKPRCMMPVRPYGPGSYDVSVRTHGIVSNALTFTVE
jgi:hypothetical protein